MKFIAYVLVDGAGKFYKGVTSNLKKRLSDHRSGQTRTTARMQDLRVAYTEEFDSFEGARKRELYFKSSAGRRFLKSKIGPIVQR